MKDSTVGVSDERDLGTFIPSFLDDFGLNPYQFRIYCRLARRAGAGGQCWESINNIAKACQINRKTVMGAIASLLRFGAIRQEKRTGKSDLYKLTAQKHWISPSQSATKTPLTSPSGGHLLTEPVRHEDNTSPSDGQHQSAIGTTPVHDADIKVSPQGSSLSSPQELREEDNSTVETERPLGGAPKMPVELESETPQAAIDFPTASGGVEEVNDYLSTSLLSKPENLRDDAMHPRCDHSSATLPNIDTTPNSNEDCLLEDEIGLLDQVPEVVALSEEEKVRTWVMMNFFSRTAYSGRERLEEWTVQALLTASPRERDSFLASIARIPTP